MSADAELLAAAARSLHGAGHGHIKRLADDLGVSYDSLRHVLSGRRGMPPDWPARVRRLLAGRSDAIEPPPATLRPEDDRDEPCGEALDPHLAALADRAVAAGWLPAEVAVTVLGWAVHTIADNTDEATALRVLEDAAEVVRLRQAADAAADTP